MNPQGGRHHPWTTSERDDKFRYYDLKAEPELIETILEDFKPWDEHQAIRSFYETLRFLNGPDSTFESNDCAFQLKENVDDNGKRLRAHGRLMILLRELPRNTDAESVNYYLALITEKLFMRDRGFELGAILVTRYPTLFVAIPPERKQEGFCGEFLFWSWGDTEAETMENLDRLFGNLTAALRESSNFIKESTARG